MLTLEEIVDGLHDRKLGVVADKTGMHRNTLTAIRSGRNANPTYAVLKALSDYLTKE
jgi:transcriptional regulator with XRE-family HTH domain